MRSHAVGYLVSKEARKAQIRVYFTGWWSKQVNMWGRGWMEIYIKCTSDRPQAANRLVGAEQVTMWMNVDIVNALIIPSDFVARPFIWRSTESSMQTFPILLCLSVDNQAAAKIRSTSSSKVLSQGPLEQAINFTPGSQITSTASSMCSLHKLQRQIHKNRWVLDRISSSANQNYTLTQLWM